MRTSREIFGYTGGTNRVFDSGIGFTGYVFNNDPDFSLTGSESAQTTFMVRTNATTNRASALIRTEDVANPANSNRYRLGTDAGAMTNSAFIDDRRFVLSDPRIALADTPNLAINEGAIGIGSRGVGLQGDPIQGATMVLATSEMLGNVLPDGATPCACEYLQWGYWTADVNTGAAATGPFRREQAHIASWVAGEIPAEIDDVPATGIATYTGHIVGSVRNSGIATYVSAGQFSHAYNFATRTGTIDVTGFDGADYTGGSTSPGQRNDFQAAGLAGTTGGRVMVLKGSFFSAPGDAVKYQGGNFNITGTGYLAGGTFAAER